MPVYDRIAGRLIAGRRRAIELLDALGIDVDARVMDAAKLTLPDASFGCALLHLVLAVVPDPHGTARETARVLRPGGRASIFHKFVQDDANPSLLRRIVGVAANIVATNINRRLGDVLAGSGLAVEHIERSVFGGLFTVGRVGKGTARS